jgi:ADP-ribose pyrophosphatase YjhB (NUDIX family)
MYSMHKVRCRAIILDEDELLLVKNSRGSNYYALPGGHLDSGESPCEAIQRELLEELGVEADVGRLLYVYSFIDIEGQSSIEFLFEIKNGSDFRSHESHVKTHAHELSEVRWIGKNEEVHMLPKEIHEAFKASAFPSRAPEYLKG